MAQDREKLGEGEAGGSILDRLRAASRRFLLATLITIGVLCGVAAYVFHSLVGALDGLLYQRSLAATGPLRPILVVGTPALVFFGIALVIRRFAPGAGGANLARVRRAYEEDATVLDARSVASTFLLTPLSLGAGAPLGPEGPIVVVASGISVGVGRLLRLPRKVVRGLIPAGAAAGIAAIFNAPITGVVFALEEVLGAADKGVLGGVIVAAVAAAVVEKLLLGGRPVLPAMPAGWNDVRELVGFAVVGIAAGALSGGAMRLIERGKGAARRLIPHVPARAAFGGVAIGVLGLLSPPILGVGYASIGSWLQGGGTAGTAGLALAAKIAAFVVALSCGVIGGTFAPSLFMGAALGSAVGHGMQSVFPAIHAEPRSYALAGMGAFFAGVLRCPLAAVLIVLEVTGDYGLILPLMLAVALAVTISRAVSASNMVERQMEEEGLLESGVAEDPISRARVSEVMSASPVSIRMPNDVLGAARSVAGSGHRVYPVVDGEGRLTGLIAAEEIDRAAREGHPETAVEALVRPATVVGREDEAMRALVARLAAAGESRCPVVAADGSGRLVGFFSPPDLMRARVRVLAEKD